MKRTVCALLLVVAAAGAVSCGGSSAQPTPRPSGQRGVLNPIDKARDTAKRVEEKGTSEVQRYGGEYEQGENSP